MMRYSVFVSNGTSSVNLSYFAQESGINITVEQRASKEVVTADGTKYRVGKNKHTITVDLLDLYDDDFTDITSVLPVEPNLTCYVIYTDPRRSGTTTFSGDFYADVTYTPKKVINSQDNNTNAQTIITNATITLTEK